MTDNLPEGVSMTNAAQTDDASSREAPKDFSELRELLEKATDDDEPGGWWPCDRDEKQSTISGFCAIGPGVGYVGEATGRLIVAAVNALPHLLDQLSQVQRERDELRGTMGNIAVLSQPAPESVGLLTKLLERIHTRARSALHTQGGKDHG